MASVTTSTSVSAGMGVEFDIHKTIGNQFYFLCEVFEVVAR